MPSRTVCVPSATTRSPGFKPLVNDPHGSHSLAYLNGADGDLVPRIDDRHLVASLQFRHGALGDKERGPSRFPS